MISFIWAQDKNGLIGNRQKLPWRLPADLKYYKETTMGHPIVMGRKTFESIGKPLPGRTNIILTRDEHYHVEGCLVFNHKKDVITWAEQHQSEIFIVGGSEIYSLFMDEVDRLYVTWIDDTFEGDTYFPRVNWSNWKMTFRKKGLKDDQNPYEYEFQLYERIQ